MVGAAKGKITLYVDIVSPFAYLGYYFLRHSPIFENVQITYIPILLGGLMKLCNNKTPIEIRNKDRWIDAERLRWARQFHIPMSARFPAGFPKPTIQLQRFLTSVWMEDQGQRQPTLTRALDTLYAALWTDPTEGDIPDPACFARVLAPVLGRDVVDRHLARLGAAAVKNQLIANTDRAMGDGAFGLPWFQCENAKGQVEGFWGFDHLGQVVRFMELDGRGEVRALL
ncbi:uncharacterized protein PV07_08998 [Cladophialophora immunda]|uniref:Glutathione S-transferase kappa n=1 Tax=Cladophialophora immunda TaxID=569365 RepID=A0A0D2ALF0_9EURO|nr:uncharacterized protein PV07_08998 [Cladophialophora immunda]KIW25862.1 hypothetical protein PV07_08998 [Cladophialophora immunda]OQV09916.1 DSBA-like thioredoxin domain-containing protein [Cladophialophora immunda]